MVKVAKFPDDDALWLVKWIDQFQLPYGATRSTSVNVLLQKLPYSDRSHVSRLTLKQIHELLGVRGKTPEPEVVCTNVLMGFLPNLFLGAIYQRQELVAELPNSRRLLYLPFSEDHCTSYELDTHLEQISGSGLEFNHSYSNVNQCLISRPDLGSRDPGSRARRNPNRTGH